MIGSVTVEAVDVGVDDVCVVAVVVLWVRLVRCVMIVTDCVDSSRCRYCSTEVCVEDSV